MKYRTAGFVFFLACWLLGMSGCSSRIGLEPKLLQRGQVQVGRQQLSNQGSAETGDQGTAVNISSSMAIYGSGGLLGAVILALMIRSLLRLHRSLGVLIRGIETAGSGAEAVKSKVARMSRDVSVGDFIHRQVRRHLG